MCHKVHRKGKSLLLTAGDIGGILGDDLIKSTVFTDKVGKVHLFKCPIDFFIGYGFICEHKVCSDRFIEDIGVITDNGKVRIIALTGKAFKLLAANRYSTAFRSERTEKHIDYGRFTATRFAYNGGHSRFRESHRHIFQHISFAVIGEGHILYFYFGVGNGFFSPNGIGLFKK